MHIYVQLKVNAESICLYIRTVTRTHARTHTRTRTHARTHTRTHSKDFTLYSHVYYYLRSIRLLCILHRTILHLKAPDCLSCMHTHI